MTAKKSVFETLSAINVNEHTNKKGGLTYLAWSFAWGELQKAYPDSSYEFMTPVFYQDRTCEVAVTVTVEGVTRVMVLPVMDYRNNAIVEPNSRDISDNRMRCLVKCIAMHGLGLYIYGGEELPGAEVEANQALVDKAVPELIKLIDAEDTAILQLWDELTRDEQMLCHKALNSKQKTALKALLFKVREVSET